MTARVDKDEATRFLRALILIAGAPFNDAVTQRIKTWATEAAAGIIDARETGHLLGVWSGTLANRAQHGLERPSHAFLQALWFVAGYCRDKDLRLELTPIAKAWLDAANDRAREAARLALAAWGKANHGSVASAMIGPFKSLGHPIAPPP